MIFFVHLIQLIHNQTYGWWRPKSESRASGRSARAPKGPSDRSPKYQREWENVTEIEIESRTINFVKDIESVATPNLGKANEPLLSPLLFGDQIHVSSSQVFFCLNDFQGSFVAHVTTCNCFCHQLVGGVKICVCMNQVQPSHVCTYSKIKIVDFTCDILVACPFITLQIGICQRCFSW